MFKLELSEEDIGHLQAAVENMRAAPEGEEQRARILDARWRIAEKLESLARRAEAARRAAQIEVTLETGETMKIDHSDIQSISAEAIPTGATAEGWQTFAAGQPIVRLRDGRELRLRHRITPGAGR
jgi:hypothetical protein